jgi:hypothetical protein
MFYIQERPGGNIQAAKATSIQFSMVTEWAPNMNLYAINFTYTNFKET